MLNQETEERRNKMAKKVVKKKSGVKYFRWYCPGCKMDHGANCDPDNHGGWTYTNDENGVSIKPDLLIRYENSKKEKVICHSSIIDGFIEYHNDTTHEFRNQKILIQKSKGL